MNCVKVQNVKSVLFYFGSPLQTIVFYYRKKEYCIWPNKCIVCLQKREKGVHLKKSILNFWKEVIII